MFENWADTERRQKIKKTANTNPLPLPTGVLYVRYATDNTSSTKGHSGSKYYNKNSLYILDKTQ